MISAPRFAILKGTATCWSCKAETPMAGVVLVDWEEAPEEPGNEPMRGDGAALLSGIEAMSEPALAAYLAAVPGVRFMPSKTAGTRYWGNTCANCAALQGEWYLREPDGPFFPMTVQDEAKLGLAWVEVPVEAEAGYSEAAWLDRIIAKH